MPDYPAHASPAFPPIQPPRTKRAVSDFRLESNPADPSIVAPPPLVSPALTPPQTPFSQNDQRADRQPKGVQIEEHAGDDGEPKPALLPKLPHVECAVRARIPTTTGQEMWLNLYHNDADEKEHLAIVFGPNIRSRSLDDVRPLTPAHFTLAVRVADWTRSGKTQARVPDRAQATWPHSMDLRARKRRRTATLQA
jgi:GTP cyclohydrolase II